MQKIYVRDVSCFALGAGIAWYEVVKDGDNMFAWALAAVLLSGPGALNILAKVLQTRAMTGLSDLYQQSSPSGS